MTLKTILNILVFRCQIKSTKGVLDRYSSEKKVKVISSCLLFESNNFHVIDIS